MLGNVLYYAPGSRVELKDISQIESVSLIHWHGFHFKINPLKPFQVLKKQSSSLTIDNFSFSPRPIVGMFLQLYSCASDAKYFYTPDFRMAKRLKDHKQIRVEHLKRKECATNARDVNNRVTIRDDGNSGTAHDDGNNEKASEDGNSETASEGGNSETAINNGNSGTVVRTSENEFMKILQRKCYL